MDFLVPIKSTTTTRRGEEKTYKSIYRTGQKIIIIKVFLEILLSESFLTLGIIVHLTPPRMPSNTVLISGPAVGAA